MVFVKLFLNTVVGEFRFSLKGWMSIYLYKYSAL